MNNDSERKQLDGTGASIGQDLGGHPLFPRPETENGPDPRKFDHIRIHRYLPDGSKETCPRVWKGSELRSFEQVVDMYGGGKYQFQATCGSTHRIQAYSEYFYCAEPARKPFHNDTKHPGETAPPQAPPPPPPASPPAVDLTLLIKLMLDREARAAEVQAKTQEAMLRMVIERPPPPNPLEGMRDAMQLMQSMNNQQSASNAGSDPVKMLERGIAMGKDLASGDGGPGEEKIPWGGLVEAATVGLSLLKKSKSDDNKESKQTKAEERTTSAPPSPKQPQTPVPSPPPFANMYVDPTTGIPYTFHPSVGFIRLDPAMVLAQLYGQYQPPTPPLPQYPYGYPFGMPNTPMAQPPMWQPPMQPMPMAQPPIPPTPVAQPHVPMHVPTAPMPLAPIPQHAQFPAPPPPAPIAQPAAPLPQPVPPPVPPPPAPATERSARLQAVPGAAPPATTPIAPKPSPKPAIGRQQQPASKGPQQQTAPHVPTAPPTMQVSRASPSLSKAITMPAPEEATDEIWDGLPGIGDDFQEVVNDGMNSPMAQQIMQNPRYLALRDSVVKGEMSVDDVNEEFVHLLFGSKGGTS